jgi:hypothetical protein
MIRKSGYRFSEKIMLNQQGWICAHDHATLAATGRTA